MSRFNDLPPDIAALIRPGQEIRGAPKAPGLGGEQGARAIELSNPDWQLLYLDMPAGSQQILTRNPRRRVLIFQNRSNVAMNWGFQSPMTADGFLLDPGATWTLDPAPPNAIFIYCPVDNKHLCVAEG